MANLTSKATLASAEVPQGIGPKLRSLRRRIAAWFAVDGLWRVLAWLLGLMALDLAIDWCFAMDRPQRGVVLALVLATLAVVIYRRLVRPLAHRFSDDALCLLVERHFRQLGGSLISALQFSRDDQWQRQGASPALVAAAIHQGTEAAGPLEFNQVLKSRQFVLNLALVIATVGALAGVGVGVARAETMRIWFDRNVLLKERNWPQDFSLSIDAARDGVLRVPRGEDWPLGVTVRIERKHALPPDEMSLDLRGGGQRHSESLDRTRGGLHFSGKLAGTTEPIEIRVSSRGVSTPWVKVLPVDRPAVDKLELTYTSPKYAGGKTQLLAPGLGPYALLAGGVVHVRGTASKPLSTATLVHGPVRKVMPLSSQRDFDMKMPYAAPDAGVYSVELADTETLLQPGSHEPGPLVSRAAAQFTLRTLVDRKPQVQARLTGISGMIVPRARLPLTAQIEDAETFVADASIHYQWRGPVDSKQGATGREQPPALKAQLGRPAIELSYVLDLAGMKIPVGSDFSLEVEANDNNVSVPGVGKSPAILLRVVSEEELRTDLLRREKEQREELERLLKAQVGILADTRDLCGHDAADAAQNGQGPSVATRLARDQKLMGMSLTSIAKRIEDLLVEADNNRLDEGSGAMQQRLRDHVQLPLNHIAEQSVPEVVGRLDQARRLWSRPADRDKALNEAVAVETRIETELNEVLNNMIKVEDFQVVLSMLMEIKHDQDEALSKADADRQAQIKRILEQGAVDKPQTSPPTPGGSAPQTVPGSSPPHGAVPPSPSAAKPPIPNE